MTALAAIACRSTDAENGIDNNAPHTTTIRTTSPPNHRGAFMSGRLWRNGRLRAFRRTCRAVHRDRRGRRADEHAHNEQPGSGSELGVEPLSDEQAEQDGDDELYAHPSQIGGRSLGPLAEKLLACEIFRKQTGVPEPDTSPTGPGML